MHPDNDKLLQETYRLSLENNRLLHKMRRQAFLGRVAMLIFYAVLLLGPIWFYQTYLSGAMQTLLNDYQKMQGTGSQASGQLQQFMQALQQFQQKFQSFASTSTAKQ